MDDDGMDFEHFTSIEQLGLDDAPSEKSKAMASSDYSINRAPLRKHAQLTDHDIEPTYQDARSIFKDSVVDDVIRGQNELTFRGQLSDMCVLCTNDKTFQIKEIEASNSFLVFPELDVDAVNDQFTINKLIQSTAISVTSTYLEATEAPPLFSARLRNLLTTNVLDLYEASQNSTCFDNKLTFGNLLDEIQMSEKQLREELNKYPTVEHNGFLYILSEDTQSRILDEIIELCDNLSSSSEFGVTDDAINWFLRSFCDASDEAVYFLNEEKFCRARAVEILHVDRAKEWMVVEFEVVIDPLLPNGFKFKLDHLKGIAFVADNIVTGTTIKCLNADDLPSDVHQRLEKLFSIQSLWKKRILRRTS
uniref:Sister chromatid cohesion protein DCC1 n=1 Tax=Ditylenchus dipsaci TaxID=166011 RepID=A0A915D4K1_9BILA